ncbi:hypothetical protein L1987_88209 [Smallanthus sonchifolius]|nr:hypothetical protein L1987_88209 [Smallanthus sonchifolius]
MTAYAVYMAITYLYRVGGRSLARLLARVSGLPAFGPIFYYSAQKPYSSTGAGLVLRGSNSKWYQEGAIVTARHRNRLSRQLPSQPVSKQRGRVNGPRVLVQRRLSPFQQRGRGELAQGIQMGDSRSDDCRYDDVLDAKAAYSR